MRRALSLGGLLLSGAALAAPLPTYELSLQDGRFIPPQLAVKAGERFKIVLRNLGQARPNSSTPLRVEKVLSPGVTTFVVIHPLTPGRIRSLTNSIHSCPKAASSPNRLGSR
jgi:hypothetical protein